MCGRGSDSGRYSDDQWGAVDEREGETFECLDGLILMEKRVEEEMETDQLLRRGVGSFMLRQ